MLNETTVEGRKITFWGNEGGFSRERQTLVFIHGSGGTHADWNEQLVALPHVFNLAALDLPGHGQSAGTGEQDVFAYVAIIEKFLKETGIVQPVLIGHSLGAAICLGFAIKHGEKAAAIVPVGGGVRMPVNPLILDGLKNNPAETIAAIAKFSVAKTNRERFAARLADALSRTKSDTTHGDFTACNRLEITSAIKEIRIPTLVVCGTQDKMTPPALSGYLRDNIPGARLALIPEAGHFAMLENPNEFNITLTDFVNSLPQQAGKT